MQSGECVCLCIIRHHLLDYEETRNNTGTYFVQAFTLNDFTIILYNSQLADIAE